MYDCAAPKAGAWLPINITHPTNFEAIIRGLWGARRPRSASRARRDEAHSRVDFKSTTMPLAPAAIASSCHHVLGWVVGVSADLAL